MVTKSDNSRSKGGKIKLNYRAGSATVIAVKKKKVRVGGCTFWKRTVVITGGSGSLKMSTALTSGCGIACCPCTAYACNKWKQSFHRPHIGCCLPPYFSGYILLIYKSLSKTPTHQKAFRSINTHVQSLHISGKREIFREIRRIKENRKKRCFCFQGTERCLVRYKPLCC